MLNNIFIKITGITLLVILISVNTAFTQVDLSGKHLQRTAPNLLDYENSKAIRPNKNIKTKRWQHIQKGRVAAKKADIDDHVLWSDEHSYDKGTGSFKLVNTGSKDKIIWETNQLEAGKTYTVSMRCMAPNTSPAPIMMLMISTKRKGKYINNYTKMFSPSEPYKWEEFSFLYNVAQGDTDFRIYILNYRRPTVGIDESLTAYIDDIYVGEGKGFVDAPTHKIPFMGGQVRVDELGNIEVKENNVWQAFFPFIIYPDGYRQALKNGPAADDDGWKIYSKQGFNAILTGEADYMVKDGIDADLRPLIDLGWYYGNPKNKKLYRNFDRIQQRLDKYKANGMFDHLLFYHIDNEVHGTHKAMKAVTDYITNWEKTNFNNQLQIPVYILNGHPGLAAKYKNSFRRMGDITGTYITNGGFPTNSFTMLDNPANQKMPVAIAQINGNKMPLRTRLYGAIAHGAKGMGYWRDFAPNNPQNHIDSTNYIPEKDITKTPWWDDFPNIVKEVEQLMPLIQQPHWTTWKVTVDKDMIDIGTREYENEGYIIIANYNAEEVDVNFNVSGLPFSHCSIENYFSPDRQVAYMSNSAFSLRLPPYGVGVYKLKKEIPNLSGK